MAYKKYIQRNGKLYGPYLYESKRVDGKVVSEYHGSEEPKKPKGVKVRDYKKILFIFLGVFILGVLIYFLATIPNQNKLSGKAVLDVDTSYIKGEPLNGVLKFSIKEGELIPASSKIVFENSNKSYEFPLNEVVEESSSEGNYYIEGKSIEGSGAGYGSEGERIIYPEVEFVLQIYKESSEETTEVTPEIINETPESTPESNENLPEEVNEVAETVPESTEEDNPAPITGNSVRGGGFLTSLFGMTGMVSMELQKEVEGTVTKDKPFVYELQEGESAELKPKSVSIGGEEIAENTISLNIENNKVTVTTDYSRVEKGYGKDYIVDNEKIISLDLSDLNLGVEEGDLIVKLIYQDEEIIQLTTTLKEGEKSSGEVVEEQKVNETVPKDDEIEEIVEIPGEVNKSEEIMDAKNETVEEIVNSSIWDIGDFLTAEERKILTDEFGNISLKTVKSELFKERIIKIYEFGEYSVEYSYDSSLSEDVLEVQMEKDRIKFLKDIANAVSKEESTPEVLEDNNEVYIP